MKQAICILILFVASSTFAQNNNESRYSLGIKTTVAKSFYKDYSTQENKLKFDLFDKTKGYSFYSLGLTARRNFSDSSRFSLELGVLWAKYIFYRNATFTGSPSVSGYVKDYNLHSNRIGIPLSLNYQLLKSNKLKPVFHIGIKPALYVNTKEDFLHVNKQSGKETHYRENYSGYFNINAFTGAGIDFHTGKYIINFDVQLQYNLFDSSPTIEADYTLINYANDAAMVGYGESSWYSYWGGDLFAAVNLTIYRRLNKKQ